MAHTKTAARKLVTQAEWTLLEVSFPPLLKDITLGRLKQKITRSRKLQDKYRDLSRQQRGEARGKRQVKGTRPSAGNANTVTKQEIFAEALSRFEVQLEKLEAKVAKELARTEQAAAKAAAKAEKAAKATAKASKATTPATPAKSATKKPGTAAKKAASKATATARKAVSRSARGARKAAAFDRTSSAKHQGHVGARGRRRQAKRDSR